MGQRRGEAEQEPVTAWGRTPCSACPLRASKHYRKFSPGELKFIETFKIDEVRRDAGQTILTEGENAPYMYTVLSGWVMKYKALEDGRRQIINYAFPGDLLGLQGAAFGKMQHSVEALSPVTLCMFDKKKLWSLYEAHPGLGFDITWLAAHEKSILADFLVTVGQRTASERIAFVLVNLFRRAQLGGMIKRGVMQMPLTQEHLADTIGFSLVHTNRSLSRVRRLGAFEWHGATFRMLDEQALVEFASIPPGVDGPRPFI
jgi:CRP-like cAMP-binding protein